MAKFKMYSADFVKQSVCHVNVATSEKVKRRLPQTDFSPAGQKQAGQGQVHIISERWQLST